MATPSLEEGPVYECPPQLQLELVHVFFRHGERTPNDARFENTGGKTEWPFNQSATAPKTLFQGTGPKLVPINDEVDKPLLPDGRRPISCAHGDLTDRGRATAERLGRQLRNLYVEQINFMPEVLDDFYKIYLRSTQYQRTFVTLQNVFRGLYPPKFINGRQEDILVSVADPRDETLLPPEDHDERFAALLQEFTNRAAAKWNYSPEMRLINTKIGQWMPEGKPVAVDSKPLKLHGVLDTISAVTATPRPEDYLPAEFLDPGMRVTMETICAEEEFAGYVYSKEFRSLGVGRILQETIHRMSSLANQIDQISGSEQKPRLLIFACHDSTIAGILGSLGAMNDPNWFWPPYTAHVTMELFRHVGEEACHGDTRTTTGLSWYVRLRYQNNPVMLPCGTKEGNHLPGHQEMCTLASLRDAIEEFAPIKSAFFNKTEFLRKQSRI
ncbi:acid phosphatase [Colletotrichum orchidophilum]|uniref:Acid phosphatase n=1 Tax=Colletotrichum orchidophilum TaxID=1209926 RepID=A0A1G4B8W4_9PEZI|nr:acid phosphatase [Colletotrichum orchidophilum]OHE97878.1 acid phosphatase [Colletotrichum orchidophilum]